MNPLLTTKQETFRAGTDKLEFFRERLLKMNNGESCGRTERAHKDPDTSTEDRQFKKRNRSGEYPLSWYRDKENECFFGS